MIFDNSNVCVNKQLKGTSILDKPSSTKAIKKFVDKTEKKLFITKS